MAWRLGDPAWGSAELTPLPSLPIGRGEVTEKIRVLPKQLPRSATPLLPPGRTRGRVYGFRLTSAQRILRDRIVAAGWSLEERLKALNHLAHYRGAHPGDVTVVRTWLWAVHGWEPDPTPLIGQPTAVG